MKTLNNTESIRKRTALIVDDEVVNRRLLGFIIKRDYEVIYAENGLEALEILKEKRQKISIVLIDLLMPVMTGYELLEEMQNDSVLKNIPVIVLTSEKSAEVKSLQLGAVDFIAKPYDIPEVIRARVKRSVELSEGRGIINATETDPLTGLYTKGFFFEYCRTADLFKTQGDMKAMVININRFHLVNELYGHELGDRLLCVISDAIKEILKKTKGIACRCEADLFYIYSSGIEDYAAVLQMLTDKIFEKTQKSRIYLRMGIYEKPDPKTDINTCFDRAVMACNSVKNRYESAFYEYDLSMYESAVFSEQLLNDIDSAITEKQFRVYYQPKFNIRGDDPVLCSAEALVRWEHPKFGMISPGIFIPLFEENGLIYRLDKYVWEEAADQVSLWKKKYNKTLPVSVNVSRIDMYDPKLDSVLLSIVDNAEIKPSEFFLEITESVYTDNSAQILQTVERLRSQDFKVEMDDFGSGYSSLNMLTAMPIDVLKLDMRFVRNICTNDKDKRMVELIKDIAGFLNVPTVAEGVETEPQFRLLKRIGIDNIQGYYFSKPVPADEFAKFLEEVC